MTFLLPFIRLAPGLASGNLRTTTRFGTSVCRPDQNFENFVDMLCEIGHAAAALRAGTAAAEDDAGRDHGEAVALMEIADCGMDFIAADHVAVTNDHRARPVSSAPEERSLLRQLWRVESVMPKARATSWILAPPRVSVRLRHASISCRE
jgi:hypothetical protein